MSEVRVVPRPRYRMEWAIALALLATGLAVLWHGRTTKPVETLPPLPDPARVTYVDHYQMVRFPELPREGPEGELRLQQIKEWVKALQASGFCLRPFSEVLDRLRQGKGVPENTVVVFFDPAYRKTIHQILPLLRQLHAPALWLTLSPGKYRTDRRFVAQRTRGTLAASPLWDVGLILNDESFQLEDPNAAVDSPASFQWAEDSGTTGRNLGWNPSALRRLNANIRWSAADLVNRLQADLPLTDQRQLTVRPIQGRYWGTIADRGRPETFDLNAPPDRRSASVSWPGTQGLHDVAVTLKADSWFGELGLLLRSDTETRERVRVRVTQDALSVSEEAGEEVLQTLPLDSFIDPSMGLHLDLRLNGDTLSVRDVLRDDESQVHLRLQGSNTSMIQLAVYHRIHGAASAKGLHLTACPLGLPLNDDRK